MKDNMGDRMKRYEVTSQMNLMRRTFTIIRIDGKAFHTYTKSLKRPFDEGLIKDMNDTTVAICENLQGAKLGYVQSDEISIILTDFDSLKTDAWFDGNVQKMCSISASKATAEFNKLRIMRAIFQNTQAPELNIKVVYNMTMAEFDSRVFQVPTRDEAINYLLWRQKDATRNSISSVAQSLYSHKELHGKDSDAKQEMIFQKGTNWNDFEPRVKRGGLIKKNTYVNGVISEIYEVPDLGMYYCPNPSVNDQAIPLPSDMVVRTKWEVVDCPIISQDRDFFKKIIPENL